MPVTNEDAPPELRKAIEDMESKVQSFKNSLAFAAPELFDQHYIALQIGLAETLVNLYEEVTK